MKIQCNDLLEGERRFSFSYDAEQFPVLMEIAADGNCEFPVPIDFSLRARQTADLVEVDGEFATRLRLRCSRCLKPFEMDRDAPVALTYSRQLPESLILDGDGEIQLSPEEAGLIPYEGEEIDLIEGLQEQVVLSIPYRTLCSDDCKGLCSRCGADLNQGDCGCDEDAIDPRFEALKHLKLPDKS